jgi:aminoglycoside phosphotransferase (APT) family kinase protein
MPHIGPLDRITQSLIPGGRLLRAWPLSGGVSAHMTALEIEKPDGANLKLILRRHGPRDLASNPHVAAHEFRLLQILQSAGYPAPRPYYLDESGAVLPTPYLLIDYVDGQTEFAPADLGAYLKQIATQLAALHRITPARVDLAFLTHLKSGFGPAPAHPDDSLREADIRTALNEAWPLPDLNPPALLHGDFWPGNILWRQGRIAAVIDWEDACLGDPLSDVANCRLELLWTLGREAIAVFTEHYRALVHVDFTHLPYWDLRAALRPAGRLSKWGLDATAERRMRAQHAWFVGQALKVL